MDEHLKPGTKLFERSIAKIKKKLLYSGHRPVFVGELSLEASLALERTVYLVDYLVEKGMLRYLTSEELEEKGYPSDCSVIAVVGKFSLPSD